MTTLPCPRPAPSWPVPGGDPDDPDDALLDHGTAPEEAELDLDGPSGDDADGGDDTEGDEADAAGEDGAQGELGADEEGEDLLETYETPDLPVLDEQVVGDDDDLVLAVDKMIAADPEGRATQAEVVRLQNRLQDELAPEQWARVLALEEVVNARWADLSVVLARWAFHEGLRCGREGA